MTDLDDLTPEMAMERIRKQREYQRKLKAGFDAAKKAGLI